MSADPAATPATRLTSALTLVELLTSVALALLLSVLATTSFIQTRRVLLRMEAESAMHQSARFLYQSFNDSVTALQQDGAMWIESTADSGSGDGTVALTFLKGKADEHDNTAFSDDYTPGEQFGINMTRCTDLTWTAWRYDQKRRLLLTGTSSRPRQFKSSVPWGTKLQYQNAWLANMPQPLQSAAPYAALSPQNSAQAALSGNGYGTGDAVHDLSDWQDLCNNMAPAIRNVTACVFEVILNDGTVVDASTAQSMTRAIDGCWVDGNPTRTGSQNQNTPFRQRPRLIRILVDVNDPATGVQQSFSFSVQPPGMLPISYPTLGPIP